MHPLLPRFAAAIALPIVLSGVVGCGVQSRDVLGQAYVAPGSVNLRPELAQKNTAVAVLKHGDRVSIIDVRRRFVKIRTDQGAEGWVDSTELLSPEEMAQIRREREQALALPSEGAATAFEVLNIHLEPDRRSPAFAQIPEGGAVAVLAHRLAPKISGAPRPSLAIEKPQPSARKARREKQAKDNSHLPPSPPPPKPPGNWEELSTEQVDAARSSANLEKKSAEPKAAEPAKPLVMEDWALVRTKDQQIGWVLSRNLMMSIPDEVAQYAEGKRITSYFDLGTVNDEKTGLKRNWLWTTSSEPEPYDFDSWRVFLWSRHHHRYETSYRQRDIEGYFPVRVDPPGTHAFGRTFEIVTKGDDGRFRRRTYFFDGTRVHLTAAEAYHPTDVTNESKSAALDTGKLHEKTNNPGWLSREWSQLKRRLSGS